MDDFNPPANSLDLLEFGVKPFFTETRITGGRSFSWLAIGLDQDIGEASIYRLKASTSWRYRALPQPKYLILEAETYAIQRNNRVTG